MKGKGKRILSVCLALCMSFCVLPGFSWTKAESSAENVSQEMQDSGQDSDEIEETQEENEQETVSEAESLAEENSAEETQAIEEGKTDSKLEAESLSDESQTKLEKAESSEAEEEVNTNELDGDESAEEGTAESTSDESGEDSIEILVKGEIRSKDAEYVIGSYEDVSLLSYASEKKAQKAFSYYEKNGEAVEFNETIFTVAAQEDAASADDQDTSGEEEDIPAEEERTDEETVEENENALEILSQVLEDARKETDADEEREEADEQDEDEHQSEEQEDDGEELLIALIDTGVSADAEVINAVSMIGEDPVDENGHGTKMYETIRTIYPDASILSIQVFDSTGQTDAASIYAGIVYAIEAGADILNLSFSAAETEENSVVAAILEEAVHAGLTVVGAAGNGGQDASETIPGGLEEAYIFGSLTENLELRATSNYGDTVDAYIVSGSTSFAAAIASAYFAMGYSPDDLLTEGIAYADYEGEAEENTEILSEAFVMDETEEESDVDTFVIADSMDNLDTMITLTHGTTYYYGEQYNGNAYPTTVLNVSDGETSYTAFCLQPMKSSPDDGTYLAEAISDSASMTFSDNTFGLLKAALLIYSVPELSDLEEEVYGDLNDSMGSTNLYATVHAVMGYIYCEELYAVWDLEEELEETVDLIEELMESDELLQAYMETSVVYRVSVDGYQNFAYVVWEEPTSSGYVDIYKESANKTVTAGNDYYDLEGAVYSIYTDETCETEALDVNGDTAALTVEENGGAKAVELALGTYYVKETTVPQGYEQDTTVYEVTVEAGIKSWVGADAAGETAHVKETPVVGYAYVKKSSSMTELTQGHDCYNLEGAEYTLYTDADCTKVAQTTEGEDAILTLDEEGVSNTLQIPVGTYYLKETNAGTGYVLNEEIYTVEIQESETTEMDVEDVPIYDSLGVEIVKIDALTGESSPQGEATLEGAQFTIRYYDGYYTEDSLPEEATRIWVIETKEEALDDGTAQYVARLSEGYKVSGDDFYYLESDESSYSDEGEKETSSTTGEVVLPLGTIVIEETKAPNGYSLEGAYLQAEGEEEAENLLVTQITEDSTSKTGAVIEAGNTYIAGDEILVGEICIQKLDMETETNAQGDATLEGAQFAVYSENENAVVIAGISYVQGEEIIRLTTDESGCASSDLVLPFGTYRVQEVVSPEGYEINGESFTVVVDADSYSETIEIEVEDAVIHGGVRINKQDTEIGTAAQGDATLEGAQFVLYNASENSVVVEGELYESGEQITVWTTDEDGYVETSTDYLPYGTYRIVEISAPEGYLNEGTIEQTFEIREEGVLVDLTDAEDAISNEVIRGGVEIDKRDLQSGDTTAQGGATLASAEFAIVNDSENSVVVDGVLYESGETVAVLTTDENGYAATESDLLPYGSYIITESAVPDGYLAKGVLTQAFEIRTDGEIVDLTDPEDSISNQVIRGDFDLRKIDADTQNAMAYVTFKITSVTTGEYHYFMTDENGYYSSSSDWNAHSFNTNGGGKDDGLWFGLDAEGNQVSVDDSLGALPFDTYLIEEIETEVNEGYEMWSGYVVITRDGYTVELNNIENEAKESPEISTSARNEETGSNYAFATTEVTILDTVTYSGLTAGKEYTVSGILIDASTGEALLDADGNEITSSKSFTAWSESGSISLGYVLDTSSLTGTTLVVYEYLYLDGELVASHTDISDEGQTIYLPFLETTALDSQTQTHMGNADAETVEIVDTVNYSNLVAGKEYTVSGTLYNRETGEPLTYEGETFTAEVTFTAESTEGSVELTFTVPGKALLGETVVAFEQLFYEGLEIAVHEDLEDENQTVYYPEIATEALDQQTGGHQSVASSEITIVDTVDYTNLLVGETYTMTGILYDSGTGEPFLVNGEEVTSEVVFTTSQADGSVEMTFIFDGSDLDNKDLVVFESLYYEKQLIASHMDLEDENQTITVIQELEEEESEETTAEESEETQEEKESAEEESTADENTVDAVQTGDRINLKFYEGAAALCVISIFMIVLWKKRNQREK